MSGHSTRLVLDNKPSFSKEEELFWRAEFTKEAWAGRSSSESLMGSIAEGEEGWDDGMFFEIVEDEVKEAKGKEGGIGSEWVNEGYSLIHFSPPPPVPSLLSNHSSIHPIHPLHFLSFSLLLTLPPSVHFSMNQLHPRNILVNNLFDLLRSSLPSLPSLFSKTPRLHLCLHGELLGWFVSDDLENSLFYFQGKVEGREPTVQKRENFRLL